MLNMICLESFDKFYIPYNFKNLVKDKSLFFTINLLPKINCNQVIKINLKNINEKDSILSINLNEITIIQYFKEDLYFNQYDLSDKINQIKQLYPDNIIKYYIIVLLSGNNYKENNYFQEILKFISNWKCKDNVYVFLNDLHSYQDLSKIFTYYSYLYIYDQNNFCHLFEMVPKDQKRVEDWLSSKIEYLVHKLKWKFTVNKQQYSLIKNELINIRKLHSIDNVNEIITLILSKQKFFYSNYINYYVEILLHKNNDSIKSFIFKILNNMRSIIPSMCKVNF